MARERGWGRGRGRGQKITLTFRSTTGKQKEDVAQEAESDVEDRNSQSKGIAEGTSSQREVYRRLNLSVTPQVTKEQQGIPPSVELARSENCKPTEVGKIGVTTEEAKYTAAKKLYAQGKAVEVEDNQYESWVNIFKNNRVASNGMSLEYIPPPPNCGGS
ncbi:hypothetical protein FXO38_12360 [Capsicum annuum]|nr:hypothetical protein FXO37_15952 [Capsicum annuum]KAF3659990.1 hypothetical protein FXO38_12360 [Capsicum annuum]